MPNLYGSAFIGEVNPHYLHWVFLEYTIFIIIIVKSAYKLLPLSCMVLSTRLAATYCQKFEF